MESKNRETLKGYFSEGQLPTQEHFAHLIDAMLNMTDEGFRKTVENGEEISAAVGHDALLSFYRDGTRQTPLWQVGLSPAHDQLVIQRDPIGAAPPAAPAAANQSLEEQAKTLRANSPLLCLDRGQRVGIATDKPQAELDVAGDVRSSGRRGAYPTQVVKANGIWQPLISGLKGCQGFEVMAGAGLPGSGHFSLMHAIALNAYNPTLGWLNLFNRKRGIRATHAYYGRRCDRVELRWTGASGGGARYTLEARTGCNFGDGVIVQALVTQLWFDADMRSSTSSGTTTSPAP
jgi:hypothetical protein